MAPENDSNSTQSSPKIPSYNPSDRIPNSGPITASGLFKSVDGKTIEIRDVWASNLEEEMGKIGEILEKYPYVAMDTEFPGVVARPVGDFGATDITYQTLRCNVDMLKLIQLGMSFTDAQGNWAEGCACWQFNFKFSLSDDMFAADSIDLLKNSGIDFAKFEELGIDVQVFGELMMMSGLVLNPDVKWVSFHSSYDFGYLVKTLTCCDLPLNEPAFMESLHTYFPCIYDVKFMMTAVEGMYGGLSALADFLQVDRIGPMHQAGSDSLLTAQTFFSLVRKHLSGACDDHKFRGELYGLGSNHTKYKGAKTYATGAGSSERTAGSTSVQAAAGAAATGTGGQQQMQYSSLVHYPPNASAQQMQQHLSNSGFNGADGQMTGEGY